MCRNFMYAVVMGCWLANLVSCHKNVVKPDAVISNDPIKLTKRDVHIGFVPDHKRVPAYLTYRKVDYLTFYKSVQAAPFTLEIAVDPLMRNPVMTASVMSHGKVVRKFVAKKTPTSLLSDKSTSWSPARSKLILSIPYILEQEEVVITTSYEWMDIRWLAPIMFQDHGLLKDSKLTVDVPYGTTMHFKAALERQPFEFLPTSTSYEQKSWAQEDNRSGLGMRHVWQAKDQVLSDSKITANQLQLFLSFETPRQNGVNMKFDSWQTVASYLYDRIEQYDVPSEAIREYTKKKVSDVVLNEEKAKKVLEYAQTIKKRIQFGSYQDQEVQPATRTFARNYGSPFDIVVLAKAMLASIDIPSDLVVAADKRYNPSIIDFYSPALFYSVLLAVDMGESTLYFDPESNTLDQLSANLQGQHALLLRPKNAIFFNIPYAFADNNRQAYSYQLWMNSEGVVEGDYSVDITGLFADALRDLSHEQLKLALPGDIQTRIFGALDPAFSWATMDIEALPMKTGYSIFGSIKPKPLAKNNDGDYELDVKNIASTITNALNAKTQKSFSNISALSVFLSLPDYFEIKNLPEKKSLILDGVDSKFYSSFGEGKLTLEAQSTISLPLKKDVQDELSRRIFEHHDWQEHAIIIHDKNLPQGVIHDEQPTEQPLKEPEPVESPRPPEQPAPQEHTEPEKLFEDQTSP